MSRTTTQLGSDLRGRILRALEWGWSDVIVFTDRDLTIRWVSPSMYDVGGWLPDELIGRSALELVHPDDLDRVAQTTGELVSRGVAYNPLGRSGLDPSRFTGNTVRARRADGGWATLDSRVQSFLAVEDIDGLVFVLRDVSDRAAADAVLEMIASDAPLDDVVPALITAIEAHLRGSRATIYLPGDRLPAPPDAACDEASTVAAAVLRCMASVEQTTVPLTCDAFGSVWLIPVTGPHTVDPVAVLGIWNPERTPIFAWTQTTIERLVRLTSIALSSQHEAEGMRRAATLDPLTALVNRRHFEAALADLAADPSRRPCALAFVDLDRFKPINDEYGHTTGDQVLITVAERLRRAVRPTDLVGRFGGDEFVVLLRDVVDEDESQAIACRIREAVDTPMVLGGRTLSITASVGISFAPAGDPIDLLLHDADMAMYSEKSARV